MATKQKSDFEKSLQALNKLVEKMESGELTLDASLTCFKEGIALIHQCQTELNQAEQTIRILTENAGKTTLKSFEEE
ncbi:MAG: exodeoxyribonuclease VII, small subunit [uncultured bacterium]|nr:MAG: exodeoxyribonuclease VII, small subunit [uncultured bacterium]OGT26174.1 MAG: exodeoxyribonuclease VII small subunit [Gammaproteobacteria bacterium RIFCSPHIGHO2_02_FULL_42_43]OGT27886.1 MAG: exodeoxyribonuclease VII small subunit [Gammaproteobacteria bacterium RIFCSPHIGHO2_01_FULL_42_8]OGT52552.1 MAG: exodeoxyribonuclease VII small subunit [Gammaproteobacteria bacterium RIFCSPHIGHO2_12_FULL_41_25]OGT63150.1 MAG: exodeoxyribonuclease VII small subunit [Gammaproteobacteria bacterium RIFCS